MTAQKTLVALTAATILSLMGCGASGAPLASAPVAAQSQSGQRGTLPTEYLDDNPLIGDAPIGAKGYVTSWTMEVDSDKQCWLDSSHDIEPYKRGTIKMLVERRADGWHVWPPAGEKWDVGDTPMRSGRWVPVVQVHTS